VYRLSFLYPVYCHDYFNGGGKELRGCKKRLRQSESREVLSLIARTISEIIVAAPNLYLRSNLRTSTYSGISGEPCCQLKTLTGGYGYDKTGIF
jgi:hypothetical protein